MIRECCDEQYACGDEPKCGLSYEPDCIRSCVREAVRAGVVVDGATVSRCENGCAQDANVTPETADLIACLFNGAHPDGGVGNGCFAICFSGS